MPVIWGLPPQSCLSCPTGVSLESVYGLSSSTLAPFLLQRHFPQSCPINLSPSWYLLLNAQTKLTEYLLHSGYQKTSVELNLFGFYWSPDMVFNRASLPYGGCIVNMANQTTPANASLNQSELSLDDSGSSPWRFIDWVVNPLIPSEPTEIFKPVYPWPLMGVPWVIVYDFL